MQRPADFAIGMLAVFMLIAGIVHVALIESHLTHAIGAGLFFLVIGVGQVAWAAWLFSGRRDQLVGGLAIFAVAPSILYLVTRHMRAPWSSGPEAYDALGIAALGAQLFAIAFFVLSLHMTQRLTQTVTVLGLGCLLGLGGYGIAISVEDVPMLSQSAVLHGGDHPHGGVTGEHGEHAHSGEPLPGMRGVSVIGNMSYYGPGTASEILSTCQRVQDSMDCWLYHLKGLLQAHGSVPAFDVLDDMVALDAKVSASSHAMAHELGHHAFQSYGLDITLTLSECSYKVFQGCLHGALQAFFADLSAQGKTVDQSAMRSLCAGAETSFEAYSCTHGVGHGVMMHSNYDLHASLDDCGMLASSTDRGNCVGGVFMENVVAYLDSLKPDYVPHHGDEPPEFWVDEENPQFPCNVVKSTYKNACWAMQTSLILRFNGRDFRAASLVCDDAGEQRLSCYRGIGRDAGPLSGRNPVTMSKHCSYGAADAEEICARAFTAGTILAANDPHAALPLCAAIQEQQRSPCYDKVGELATTMLTKSEAEEVCAKAPAPYDAQCRDGMRT